MKSFVELATSDAQVKKLHALLKRGVFNIDLKAYQEELERMNSSRLFSDLRVGKLRVNGASRLAQAILQNQAYRTRVVTMKMDCWKCSARLDHMLSKLKAYLRDRYAKTFSEYKNFEAREAALDVVFSKPKTYQQRLDSFVELADMMIDDLDKSGWMGTNLVKVLDSNVQKGSEL